MSEVEPVWREAKFYNRRVVKSSWLWLVVHCTESPREDDGRAFKVARWFANPWDPRRKRWVKASAHYIVDDRNVVQCVPDNRIAWHARGANNRAIGVELVGKAAQSRDEWLDDFGIAMLELAAALVAGLVSKHGIPPALVDPASMRSGLPGITTHANVTRAFKVRGGHIDPGPNFPMDILLDEVAAKLRVAAQATPVDPVS